jgi:serine/threonine-protein kinase
MKICPVCGITYDDSIIFCPADGGTLRSESAEGDLVGSVIADRYLITGKLGHGGMGSVYLAQHVRLPQRAAIKVLHKSLTFDSDSIARFNREAQHASSINNEHVARIYDFGEMDGVAYLAMEYVEGETLSALLQREGALDTRRVSRIVRQIASGLDAAHKLGIVHRDLKPDNVLVSTDADGADHVKVVDFGIAKAVLQKADSVTQTGLAIGTAEFMSPEQVAGELVDRRTDVYALGLVAFVMLTGKLPFQGQTKELSMLMRLTQEPLTLTATRPDLNWPAGLQSCMSKALALKVDDRHPSAGEFARKFADVADAHSNAATMVTAPAGGAVVDSRGAGGIGSRKRLIVAASAAASLFLLALFLFLPRNHTPASPNFSGSGGDLAAGDSGGVGTNVNAASASGATGGQGSQEPTRSASSGGVASDGGGASDSAGRAAQTQGSGAGIAAATGAGAGAGAGGGVSGRAAQADADLRITLQSIEFNVDPLRITSQSAQQALTDITRVLPLLRTRSDSARVEMQRIEAHIALDQKVQACNFIRALLPRADSTDLRALRSYQGNLQC